MCKLFYLVGFVLTKGVIYAVKGLIALANAAKKRLRDLAVESYAKEVEENLKEELGNNWTNRLIGYLCDDEFASDKDHTYMAIGWKENERAAICKAIDRFNAEMEELRKQEHPAPSFRITTWYPVLSRANGQTDWDPTRIIAEDDVLGARHVGSVKYSYDTKDGLPVVEEILFSTFRITGTTRKVLTYEKILQSVQGTLKKSVFISYIEGILSTLDNSEDGEAVFNAKVILQLSDEEWQDCYGSEEKIKAWCDALSERIGGLEPLPVRPGEIPGTFVISKYPEAEEAEDEETGDSNETVVESESTEAEAAEAAEEETNSNSNY